MKRGLLVPLLLPLAAALAVANPNLRVPARLRLLIWTSPPLPLGTWVLIAAGGGAAAAALAGLSAPGASPRQPEPWDEPRRRRTRRTADTPEEPLDSSEAQQPFEAPEPTAQASPERSAHEAPSNRGGALPGCAALGQRSSLASSVDDWNDAADDDW